MHNVHSCMVSLHATLVIPYAVREITVLRHFHKNDLMPVICKNDKHLVALYNVIF